MAASTSIQIGSLEPNLATGTPLEAIKSAADKADAWPRTVPRRAFEPRRFETVMSAPNKVEFVARAKGEVFCSGVFRLTESPTINASRVAQPYVYNGGHDVPIPRLSDAIRNPSPASCLVTRYADRVY